MEESSPNLVTSSEGPQLETWNFHRPTITRYYLDEQKTLGEIKDIMQREHNFKASDKMYKQRLRVWNIDNKNFKRAQVKQIVREKVERDAVGKPSTFYIKQREVDMAKIAQYIKKRGFQTLESFAAAASPVEYSDDVSCKSPARTPTSHVVELDEDGNPELIQDAGSHIPYPRRTSPIQLPIAAPLPLSFNQRWIPWHDPSLSPVAGLRYVLSLSPIPRTPPVPEIWSVPEQLLSIFSVYMKGSFENRTWRIGSNGNLRSVKENHRSFSETWASLCYSAVALLRQKKYVQSRQMFAQMFLKIEASMKAESFLFLPELWDSLYLLQRSGSHEIFKLVVNHSHTLATHLVGNSHPLSQICGVLKKSGSFTEALLLNLHQCRLDVIQQELGLWHSETICAQSLVLNCMNSGPAVSRAQTLLQSYEKIGSKYDDLWFYLAHSLASSLFEDGQYAEVEYLCNTSLHALNHASGVDSAFFKLQAFLLLTRTTEQKSSLLEAERYAQKAVVESGWRWSMQGTVTVECMLQHARLLRRLDRFEEADEIDGQIDNILGPPDIRELLND